MSCRFSAHPARRAGFSMLEVLVVVAILAMLAALVLPLLGSLRKSGNMARCIANLKQISVASALYSAENNGRFPPCAAKVVYSNFLLPYLEPVPPRSSSSFKNSPFVCPNQKNGLPDGTFSRDGIYIPDGYGLSYAQNDSMHQTDFYTTAGGNHRSSIQKSAAMMLYMDFENQYAARPAELTRYGRWNSLGDRHGGDVNVAFADGSVRSVPMEDVPLQDAPTLFWQGRTATP